MTTVMNKVTKKDRDNLFNAVETYLQLNALIASKEDQKDGLKMVINSILQKYPALIEDGEVVLEGVGRIKQVENKPVLISLQTGNPLVPAEAAGLLKVIGAKYANQSVAVMRVSDAIKANNEDLIAKLKAQEVELRETSRFDIKPPLKAQTDEAKKTKLAKR